MIANGFCMNMLAFSVFHSLALAVSFRLLFLSSWLGSSPAIFTSWVRVCVCVRVFEISVRCVRECCIIWHSHTRNDDRCFGILSFLHPSSRYRNRGNGIFVCLFARFLVLAKSRSSRCSVRVLNICFSFHFVATQHTPSGWVCVSIDRVYESMITVLLRNAAVVQVFSVYLLTANDRHRIRCVNVCCWAQGEVLRKRRKYMDTTVCVYVCALLFSFSCFCPCIHVKNCLLGVCVRACVCLTLPIFIRKLFCSTTFETIWAKENKSTCRQLLFMPLFYSTVCVCMRELHRFDISERNVKIISSFVLFYSIFFPR